MEKNKNNNETLGLISLFVNRALNDPNGPDEIKIVLPDECGDTLWDKVLNQDIFPPPPKEGLLDFAKKTQYRKIKQHHG